MVLREFTFSLWPNWGASTVMNRALIPRLSAFWTIRFVILRSLFTYLKRCHFGMRMLGWKAYSWKNWTWFGWAASTISSKEHEARVGIWHASAWIRNTAEVRKNHLNNAIFGGGPSQIQFTIWMTEFSKGCSGLLQVMSRHLNYETWSRLTIYMGILEGYPRIVVDQSTVVTSRNTRGLNHILYGAVEVSEDNTKT